MMNNKARDVLFEMSYTNVGCGGHQCVTQFFLIR